jgi:small subunit ribosomal protein S17
MADKKDKKTTETADEQAPEATVVPEAPEAESSVPDAAPDAEAEAAEALEAEDSSVPDAAPDAEAEAAEAPEAEDSPVPDAAPDAEAEAAEAPALEAPAPTGEPAAVLSPKQRRRKARSTHTGEARPVRTAEERHVERVAERQRKAARRRARRLQEREKKTTKRQSATATPVAELAPVHAPVEGKRSVRQGIVVSDKADKTITVRIDFARRHRRYEKIVRSSSTLHAHDESNEAHEGDVVRVIESRPLSKSKRWKLVDVLERAR